MHELKNANGCRVLLSEIGASVCRVLAPDRNGTLENISLSPADDSLPRSQLGYAGAVLGPSAGRVPGGIIMVDGAALRLPANEGATHLHGGPAGLSDVRWSLREQTEQRAVFCCERSFSQDGYPGNRCFTVRYALADDDSLTIRLSAVSDCPTWINLSSHLYWNLSGDFARSVADHMLLLDADAVYRNDVNHLPTEIWKPEGTALDFHETRSLRAALDAGDPLLSVSRGYNHCYLLNRSGASPQLTLTHPESGRTLTMATSSEAMMLYSGGYLNKDLLLKGGVRASRACAIAFEPQLSPVTADAPVAPFVTTPSTPFWQTITYRFGVTRP